MRINVLPFCLAGVLIFATGGVRAETGFRGDGSGVYPQARPPLHWSADSNVTWTARLKWSNASPVLLGDRVITCEEPDVLLAVAFADGRVLWAVTNGYADVLSPAEAEVARESQKKADALQPALREADKKAREADKAAKEKPDDAEAKARVTAARQDVAALRKQLEPLQKYRLPSTHGVNGYTTPTPVTDGKNIYTVFCSGVVAGFSPDGRRLWSRILPVRPHSGDWGHSASPRLAEGTLLVHFGNRVFAMDPQTGADKWTADAPSGFGSPIVARVDDAPALLTPGGDFLAVADGRKLATGVFKFPWNGPVVANDTVYKVDEGGATAFSLKLAGAAKPAALWHGKVPGGRYYATAVALDGLLYNVAQNGTLVVLDAKDGSTVYEKALGFGGGTAYPSPVAAGGRLYVSNDNGVTVVIKPGRTYEELARNKLPDFRSCPVFVGDSLLVRTTSGLLRIQEK
jgi:outer membrane protein assembly factor BamB